MVDYPTWFGIVQTQADVDFDDRGGLTQEIADYWTKNRADLESMTEREARQLARELLS